MVQFPHLDKLQTQQVPFLLIIVGGRTIKPNKILHNHYRNLKASRCVLTVQQKIIKTALRTKIREINKELIIK